VNLKFNFFNVTSAVMWILILIYKLQGTVACYFLIRKLKLVFGCHTVFGCCIYAGELQYFGNFKSRSSGL